MSKPIYESLDLNNNGIENADKIQLTRDAQSNDEAVRKLQAETLSALAVQAKLISNAAQKSSDTAYTSLFTQTALDTKQPNMEIDPSSTEYLEIVDGYKIKLKDLGVFSSYVDTTHTTKAAFIAACTFNGDDTITIGGEILDANTIIYLDLATLPKDRSFIYLGTNNGDESDFFSFAIDYNQQVIRTFFDAAGVGLQYDELTGIYSLVFGTGINDLGAQTIPVDPTEFTTVNGSTVLAILKALETFIVQVDANATGGSTTINTRLTSLAGVSGNNLESFTQGIFSSNSSIKAVLQESEVEHKSAQTDRALIRSQFAAADTALQANIDAETIARTGADVQLQANIDSEASARAAQDAILDGKISTEESARISADNALSVRLDVVEGSGAGSIEKAEQDAKNYADAAVLVEKSRAEVAEAALDLKIDNLSQGDIQLVGKVEADGRISIDPARVAAGDTRNNSFLKDVAVAVGEVFIAGADVTITYDDSSESILQQGDQLLCWSAASAGALKAGDFNQVQADGSSLTIANLDDQRIELKLGKLDIVADSIGRDQLDSAIEADIDDKRSLTVANAITSDGDTHFVTSSDLGAQQNIYHKRDQLGTGPLSGTVRTKLSELHIHSDGSGNPLAPSYAHVETISSHYKGNCSNLSMVMGGVNAEANAKAGKAIQATGVYATALQEQNGINVGVTAIANGAALSNVGGFFLAGTAGIGTDRGLIGAVATGDAVTYSAQRQLAPFPFSDIAVSADAKFGPAGCKAFYAYGDVVMEGGSVVIPSASADDHAMNLGDMKAKQKVYKISSLLDGVQKVFSCPLDLEKCIWNVIDNNEQIQVEVIADVANGQFKVKALGADLTDVRLNVIELSVDEEVIS